MRNDRKQVKSAEINRVQSYHEGGRLCADRERYAFEGFRSNKYFTSDRYEELDESFRRKGGQALKGYGLEIETECSGISNETVLAEVLHKIIFDHFPADLFKLQRDGSLCGSSSAECITQIMTREFVRNNYASFKLMYDVYFPAFGIGCASGNCGMHVNISNACFGAAKKTQDEAIRKLYYIVNKHFDFCCELFRRDRRRLTYCARMDAGQARTMDLSAFGSNHYCCFNLGHYSAGRIELRIVGGQKNYASFRNTMECVFWLVDAVKRLSWSDCDDLVKIFRGCNQYVFDRIRSYCREAGTIRQDQVDEIRGSVVRADYI